METCYEMVVSLIGLNPCILRINLRISLISQELYQIPLVESLLNHPSKTINSLIRKLKKVNGDWIDDQIKS